MELTGRVNAFKHAFMRVGDESPANVIVVPSDQEVPSPEK